MAIKIEMLRCFCTVAQTGNLAEASERLGRTQSAVSMTLKQLESHLGQTLFEGERKNRLSPLGRQVFELGLKQLRRFDSTVQAIEDSAKAPQGILRIASVPSVAALIYPDLVQYMSRRFPGLHMEFRDADTQTVMDALDQGWADIGITSTQFTLKDGISVPLFQDRFGLVCAKDHALAMAPQIPSLVDVLASPFLRNTLCDRIQSPLFQQGRDAAMITVHNTQSLIAMVRSGDWVTILPQTVLKLVSDNVQFRPIVDLPDTRQVHLYLRKNAHSKDIADDVFRFIAAQDWTG